MGGYAELKSGTRVRLRSFSHVLTPRGDTGTVVGPDSKWDDYYIIRLDQPAIYKHADGRQEDLSEIREDIDNLDVVQNLNYGEARAV